MLFRPLFVLLTLVPTLAQAGGAAPAPAAKPAASAGGCDTMDIDFRGGKAPFSQHMERVESRINQICSGKVPGLNQQISELGKSCAGSGWGVISDYEVSMDQRVKSFQERALQLCQYLTEAKKRIRGDENSFCGRLAQRSGATAELFSANTTPPAGASEKKNFLDFLNNLQQKHNTAASTFNGVTKDASQIRDPIDKSLPEKSNNSARTDDEKLHYYLDLTEKARQGREAEIQKQASDLQAANPPDGKAKMGKLNSSLGGCRQLQTKMKDYVDMLENNLLPNGRMMSKLLTAAQKVAQETSKKHTDKAQEIGTQIAKLKSDMGDSGPAVAAKPNTGASDVTGTAKQLADNQKAAAIINGANMAQPSPDGSSAGLSKSEMQAALGDSSKFSKADGFTSGGKNYDVYQSVDNPKLLYAVPSADQSSAHAPAAVSAPDPTYQNRQANTVAAAPLGEADPMGEGQKWLDATTHANAPAAKPDASASTNPAQDLVKATNAYTSPGAGVGSSEVAAAKPPAAPSNAEASIPSPTQNSLKSGDDVTKEFLDANKADAAKQAEAAAQVKMAKDLGIDDIEKNISPSLAQQKAAAFNVNPAGADPALAPFAKQAGNGPYWQAPAGAAANSSIYTPWSSTAPPTSWIAPDGKASSLASPPIYTDLTKPAAPQDDSQRAPANSFSDRYGNFAPAGSTPQSVPAPSFNDRYGEFTPPSSTTAPAQPSVPAYSSAGFTHYHSPDVAVPSDTDTMNRAASDSWDDSKHWSNNWTGYSATGKSFTTQTGDVYTELCNGSTCYYRKNFISMPSH